MSCENRSKQRYASTPGLDNVAQRIAASVLPIYLFIPASQVIRPSSVHGMKNVSKDHKLNGYFIDPIFSLTHIAVVTPIKEDGQCYLP